MIFVPYLLGCLAAVANAATNVMQRAANREESQRLQFSVQLIKNLLRKPLWLASIATMLVSFVLQAAGLGLGTLAAIEPLLVLELPPDADRRTLLSRRTAGHARSQAPRSRTQLTRPIRPGFRPAAHQGGATRWLLEHRARQQRPPIAP